MQEVKCRGLHKALAVVEEEETLRSVAPLADGFM